MIIGLRPGTHCVAVRLFIHVSPGGTEALALQEFCRQVAVIEGGKQEPVIRLVIAA